MTVGSAGAPAENGQNHARDQTIPVVTRFAPSPTGYLHLGHAHSALLASRAARGPGDRFLLRIENTDPNRCRPEYEAALLEDLAWLGLRWETPVRRQSEHMADYRQALDRLIALGVTYPCFCSRAEIAAEIARAAHAPHGAEGPLYPGTCRHLSQAERNALIAADRPMAVRLDANAALELTGPLTWYDRDAGRQTVDPMVLGDVVVARKDIPTSYHLSVTVDDHRQGITLVTRGLDIFPSTHVHRLLQGLLGYGPPTYHHHRLLTNERGERLAKRDRSLAIRQMREAGMTAAQVRTMAGFPDGAD